MPPALPVARQRLAVIGLAGHGPGCWSDAGHNLAHAAVAQAHTDAGRGHGLRAPSITRGANGRLDLENDAVNPDLAGGNGVAGSSRRVATTKERTAGQDASRVE